MPDYNFKNNLKSTLQAKLWNDATSISCSHVVVSEDADIRRNAWPAFPFTLTVINGADNSVEIVKCTSLASNTVDAIVFNCDRAQENTAAQTFEIATTRIEHRLTAGALNTMINNTSVLTNTGTLTAGSAVINLNFSYDTSKKNIAVYISGVLQAPSSWTATSSTSLTLSESLADDVPYYVASASVPAESILTSIYNDTVATVSTLTMHMGSVISVLATDTYVPTGCVPCNGTEYTRSQFPTLYDSYLAAATPKLLTCTYTEWSTQVDLTGNCAKFAVDTANQTFKVPMLKDGDSITQAITSTELGKSYKAGLPNITGQFSNVLGAKAANGIRALSFSGDANSYTLNATSPGSVGYNILTFNAANANAIYGNSTTVTNEQVRLRHFVVVATAQTAASQFDWSTYMAGLQGKANVALDNLTQMGTTNIAHSVTPSSRTVSMTLPATGTLSSAMPGDGYLKLVATSTATGQYIRLSWNGVDTCIWSTATGQLLAVYMPCMKGQTISVEYTAPTNKALTFSYSNGAY